MDNNQDNIIQGNPTKTFFIEMITRDISIKDAILDLLDNSIDGASRINPISYQGLYINISINKDAFIVNDNCGGFSLETAKKYAFRFGRPDDAPEARGSVGRFGIGMKRALFKIGKKFEVESKTSSDHFEVNVDVNEWRNKTKTITQNEVEKEIEDWDFRYVNITEENCNLSENGTYVKVTNLHSEVADLFDDEEFLNTLKDDIERLLNFSLEKKIKITLNGQELNSKDIKVFNEQSEPYFYEGEKDGVKFRIIAGLGDVGNPSVSGWYIYCNDRLVLEADKTEATGWGTSSIPKWHIDYVMFRGIVFLDAEETINLPLTTTKKGIDTTSDIYKSVLVYMREATSHIIPFLKQITKLGDEANNYRKLLAEQETKISVVDMKSISITPEKRKFVAPEIDTDLIAQRKDFVRISYDVKKDMANKTKYHSGSKSYKELGETTFYYYIKMEDLENE
ncbi:ATP-binding protein [Chryseobacterium sp. SL1]|uniref:ATP-binding protein n=1 Tax=Chryseobacterium sp. SL1 TaxID=2995159 RepID=UPI0022742A8F|nr:ATP-binding protein [Chryseobacterium sp. SL1]MCY1661092.1 ATP-binding protein [Chryseobacterium sp. SL1]